MNTKNVTFGATLDQNTRDYMFLGRSSRNPELAKSSEEAMKILSEIYEDRYVKTTCDDNGISNIRIECGPLPIPGEKAIDIFKSKESRNFNEIISTVVETQKTIKATRSPEQIEIDQNYKNW